MQIKKKNRGICHWWEPECLIRSVGHRIDLSTDNGDTFSTLCYLNYEPHKRLASMSRLGSRLLRTNPKHFIKLTPELFLIFAAGSIYQLNLKTKSAIAVSSIIGSRPLRVAFDGESVFYGEYCSNPNREPICVYKSSDFGITWDVCYEFSGIRHVHGVFFDAYSSDIWITTGDYGEEAAIWRTDSKFSSIEKVVSGGQHTRVIDLLFEEHRIFFGTDAPEEPNWLCAMSRDGSNLERIAEMSGPVFHAKKIAGELYFSTACEPAKSTVYTHSELIGISNSEVQTLSSLKKDKWSMKYFQYGQIFFPDGPGVEGQLWYSSFACKNDQFSFLLTRG